MRARRRAIASGTCVGLLLCGVASCDPKAGFESAAKGINPDEKSYVDGPGSRIAKGSFQGVGMDFDSDDGPVLLGFNQDKQGPSVTLFHQNDETGCTIMPDAWTQFPSKPSTKPYRLLPYLESLDASLTGTMRFSSIDCKIEPYYLDDVVGPIQIESERGFVVKQGNALVLADPWAGTTATLVSDFHQLIFGTSKFSVWGDSQIVSFDVDATEVGRSGNHVSSAVDISGGNGELAVEDDDGIHIFYDGSFVAADPDACALSQQKSVNGWVLVHSPCTDPHVVAERLGLAGSIIDRIAFSVQVDPKFARLDGIVGLLGAADSGDALPDATLFYLEDVDPSTGLGTLFATTADGAPLRIGENADLQRASVLGVSRWSGEALVEVQNGVGRLVGWEADGTEATLAENVDAATPASFILSNYTGYSGDVVQIADDGLPLVTQVGSPPFDTTLFEGLSPWVLRLDHFNGGTGDLSLAKNSYFGGFETTAHGVPPGKYQFLDQLPLPGFAYLADYDVTSFMGTLSVQNLTLGSTSVVAKNVSDFSVVSYPLPGLLYSVPSGENAGIWLARAK